jgi:DNA-binding winged helix-turn-helix (wHTH) protein
VIRPERLEIWCFGDIVADPNRLEVRRQGQIAELEPKALRVLFYLIDNRGRVVSKEELIREVWAGTAVTDNALTRVIAQIRKQLGDDARSPRYVQTASSAGYRFIAELRTAPAAGTDTYAAAPTVATAHCGVRDPHGGCDLGDSPGFGQQPAPYYRSGADHHFHGAGSLAGVLS